MWPGIPRLALARRLRAMVQFPQPAVTPGFAWLLRHAAALGLPSRLDHHRICREAYH
jgi:hypothetical protein